MRRPENEPILEYVKGSAERKALETELTNLASKATEVPLRIGTKKITNTLERSQVMVRCLCYTFRL